jgi:hypothetical protein
MVLLLVATAATFAVAVGLQLGSCVDGDCTRGLGDVAKVYVHRGVRPDAPPYIDRMVEYPVVTGAVIYAASFAGDSPTTFLLAIAALNGVLALAVTGMVGRVAPQRAWRWALAPPLALFGAHNWDLLAIAPLVAGLLAFERRRDGTAGVLLAIGASAKLFPGVVIPPLIALRLARGDREGAMRLFGGAAITTALLNVPVMLADFHGWMSPFQFHGDRRPTWASLMHWVFRLPVLRDVVGGDVVQAGLVVSTVGLAVVVAFLTWYAARRRPSAIGLAAAATALFLLVAKVHSPGYDLWLIPFFVLLPLARWHYAAFCATDLGVYVLTYGMLDDQISRRFVPLLGVLAVARAVLIALVAWRGLHTYDERDRVIDLSGSDRGATPAAAPVPIAAGARSTTGPV